MEATGQFYNSAIQLANHPIDQCTRQERFADKIVPGPDRSIYEQVLDGPHHKIFRVQSIERFSGYPAEQLSTGIISN